jgi:ABC-type nitrate/sulfonate/bicarbonate transport system permease component
MSVDTNLLNVEGVVAERTTRTKWLKWLKSRPSVIGAAGVILFFICWEYFGRSADPMFMTYPSAILYAAWEMTKSGDLPRAFAASMVPFGIGLAISIVGGIAIGIAIGQFWFIEYLLNPFVSALYAIPRIALIPLIILWAGLETSGKVVIIASIAIFPVIINTIAGLKDVRGSLIEIGKAYGATSFQIFRKIILPAAVPSIMAGVKLAVGLAIIGFVVAEFFTAVNGLGGLIVLYANNFATAKLFVPVVIIGILGVSLSAVVSSIERYLSRWRVSERERY